MKNLVRSILVLVTMLLTATTFANNTEPIKGIETITQHDIVFGMCVDNIKFIGKFNKINRLVFKTDNQNTFIRMSKKLYEYNKGYIKDVNVVLKYKNKKIIVRF